MLLLKSNGTVSNYDTVPIDFTGSIKLSYLQLITKLFLPHLHLQFVLHLSTDNSILQFNSVNFVQSTSSKGKSPVVVFSTV